MNIILNKLISESGNLIMLGRSMLVHNPILHEWAIHETTFLSDIVSFNERVYCIVNNISIVPICPVKQQPCRFINYFEGYKFQKPKVMVKPKVIATAKALDRIEFLKYASMVGSDTVIHGSKVKGYLRKNREANSHLYTLPASLEGDQYVTCPILNTRMLNIKKAYVEGILMMSMDEFKTKYPNTKLKCTALSKQISDGLTAIDEKTGLTKHEASVILAAATRELIGDDGLNSYERSGKKTSATHMSNIDENGLNGYQQLARDNRPKQIETMALSGERCGISDKSDWNRYRNFVEWLGRDNKIVILGDAITGRMGTVGAMQVDHMYSVINGFNHKVSPWVISHIANLQLVTWQENAKKTHNSSISLNTLFESANYTEDESINDFNKFIDIVRSRPELITSSGLLEIFNEKKDNSKFRHK